MSSSRFHPIRDFVRFAATREKTRARFDDFERRNPGLLAPMVGGGEGRRRSWEGIASPSFASKLSI